jgi:DNA-binding response OmpR family regulator
MRILIVEDQVEISKILKKNLEAECFVVDVAEDGNTGSYLARTNDYDLIILDYNLPQKNGSQVCQEIRVVKKNVPILILSVESDIPTKVQLLNIGADDYITKPFSFEELLARIRAMKRRPPLIEEEVLVLDDLCLDTRRHTVQRGKKDIYLTRKEFILLEYLLKNHDQVLSRGTLMEHVWDAKGDLFSNTIETHILMLRKKIDAHTVRKLIHTIPGRGYKLGLKK